MPARSGNPKSRRGLRRDESPRRTKLNMYVDAPLQPDTDGVSADRLRQFTKSWEIKPWTPRQEAATRNYVLITPLVA